MTQSLKSRPLILPLLLAVVWTAICGRGVALCQDPSSEQLRGDGPILAPTPPNWTSELLDGALRSLPSDRKTILTYRLFRESLAAGDSQSAIRELERLRTAAPDSLVENPDVPGTFVPLYRAVFDAVYELPVDSRRRLQEGDSLARIALNELLAAETPVVLPEFILQYAGTTAAAEAHLIFARRQYARGNFMAAEVWLRPLLADGAPKLLQDAALAAVRFVDQAQDSVAVGANSQPAEKKDSNTADPGAVPRHYVWQYRPLISPGVRDQLRTLQQSAASSKVHVQSTWSDRVEDGIAYRRSLRGLSAVDLKTGRAKWDYPFSPSVDEQVRSNSQSKNIFRQVTGTGTHSQSFSLLDSTMVTDTFCRNQTLGSVTDDDDYLFAVASGKSLPSGSRASFPQTVRRSATSGIDPGMRLVAVEKSTGRRVWTFGQDSMQRSMGVPSPGFWISGPPTVVGDRLYCVMEWKGEILLTCLKKNTGELVWRSVLAYPEQSIDKDPLRQMFRCRPVVEDGLIWCQTSTGCLACVDSMTTHVIWASRESTEVTTSVQTISRGRPVPVTKSKSIGERWGRDDIIRVGEDLVFTSAHDLRIVVVKAITGDIKRTMKFAKSSTMLLADESQLIIGRANEILCLNTDGLSTRWSVSLNDQIAFGRALRRGEHMIVTTNSGGLLRINLKNGDVVSQEDSVLPVGAWGELTAAQDGSGDIYYSAPESLIRLSADRAGTAAPDPIDLADGLLSTGQWQQALEMVDSVPSGSPSYAEAAEIRFQCLLQMARTNPEQWLEQLKQAAKRPDRRILVQLLETQLQLDEDQAGPAFDSLINLLSLSDQLAKLSVLREFHRQNAQSDSSQSDSVQSDDNVERIVRRWAAIRLSRLLSEGDIQEDWLSKLDSLPVASLLAIHADAIRPTLLKISENAGAEAAVQLFSHAVELAANSADDAANFSNEAAAWKKLQNRLTNSPAGKTASRLVAVCSSEFPEGFRSALAEISSNAEPPGTDTSSPMQEVCEQWVPGNFHAMPVSRNTMSYSRNNIALAPSRKDDAFLRRYDWTILRDEYGRLLAREIGGEGQQWTIPGTFQVTGSYSTRTDYIYRSGSILLIRSMSSIAAVSPLERRVIWRRDARSRQTVISWSRDAEGFDQLIPGRNLLPSDGSFRGMGTVRVVGIGRRWLCIRTNDEVRMLDVFTGELAWVTKSIDNSTHVTATDTAVVIRAGDGGVKVLDRITGEILHDHSRESDAAKSLATTFTNAGPDVVCFARKDEDSPAQVQWLNPLTAEETNTFEFNDATWFRFLDDQTLAGFNSQQEITVVDLTTGDSRQLSFAVENESASPAAFSDPKLLQVSSDALNFYITATPKPGAVPFRVPSGRMLTRFESPLRAIDRETGQLRWSFENESILMATTDQPSLPVMLVIEVPNTQPNVGTLSGSSSIFTGIHKLTGEALFTQKLPAQSGLRYLQVKSPSPNVLDIGVPGNLIRLSRSGD